MAKEKVRPHTRKGGNIEVAGYERIKAQSDKKKARHPAQLDPATQPPAKGTQIVTRDPDRHGQVKSPEGVQILGRKGPTGGVTRVNRT